MLRDIQQAARALRKSPAFTATAVLTMALGIGAGTAIFSVVDAVLLRSLPYRQPERLVLIWSDLRARNVADFPISGPDFDDLRRTATLFDGIAAVNTGRAVIPAENGEAEMIRTGNVTPNFFRLLGGRIVAGPRFHRDGRHAGRRRIRPPLPARRRRAHRPPRPPTIAILSHDYWRKRFGGDAAVIGRSIDFGNGGKAQVVGVLEPGFELLFPPKAGLERLPAVWTAMRANFSQGNRNNVGLRLVGRIKAGVGFDQAQAEVERLAAGLRERFPIKATSGMHFRLERMHDNLVAEVRPAIRALMGAVIFLLLIACANVANLLLLRAGSRSREMAVRAALGGARWHLIRQVLAESYLLAAAGALLGLALARTGNRSAGRDRPGEPAAHRHSSDQRPRCWDSRRLRRSVRRCCSAWCRRSEPHGRTLWRCCVRVAGRPDWAPAARCAVQWW